MNKVFALIATLAITLTSAGNLFAKEVNVELLFKRKCMSCHNKTEKKKVGPGLKGVYGRKGVHIEKLDDEGLYRWLKNPKAVTTKAKMPNRNLSDEQIKALIEYLKTL